MSDYTTPVASDKSVENLAQAINSFFSEVSKDVQNINESLADVVNKYYTVNHEPQIELPFEGEYQYIHDAVNKKLQGSKTLDDFTHIFLSGYLPNGKTIHYNALEEDERGFTHSRYAAIYINGKQMYGDYTCRAEEGGIEKLNILIIGAPKMGTDAAKLKIDYADIPLKNFKMIIFDDLEEPVNPDINSFLAEDIDTLKYIGDLSWVYTGICTLRRLEITKDIYVTGTMNCPCIKELIIPNVTNVPNTNSSSKGSIVLCDISNVKGIIENLAGAKLGDLKLKCSSIGINAFSGARLGEVNIGNSCQTILGSAFSASSIKKLIGGSLLTQIENGGFYECSSLTEVIFNNLAPLSLRNNIFFNCSNLKNVHFSYIAYMTGGAFIGCTSLTNLHFIDKSISCDLYFGASPVITEQSCLNIINAIADNAKITVQLHSVVKNHMANDWYCKKENSKYVSCTADDEGAVTQAAAIIAKGGTLA